MSQEGVENIKTARNVKFSYLTVTYYKPVHPGLVLSVWSLDVFFVPVVCLQLPTVQKQTW